MPRHDIDVHEGVNLCGNIDHPNGAWHPNEPVPGSWEWKACFRYWWNTRKWGCGCPRRKKKE